jgi:tetratricopeptide (TPR) repeat protein
MNLPNFSRPVLPFSATLNGIFRIGFAAMLLSCYCAGAEARSQLDWRNVPFVRVPTENVARLANEANSALINDNDDVAIARCNTALSLHPEGKIAAFLYYLRAEAYCDKNRSQAMNDAETAIRVAPSAPYGYIARGVLNSRWGKDKLAIVDFDEAIRRDPKHSTAYGHRGVSYDLIGNVDRASADYSEAIRREPRGARIGETHFNRGQLYLQKHDYRAALADLQVALARAKAQSADFYRHALNAIAWVKATCPDAAFRDGKKAVELSTKACELSHWKSSGAIDTLAAAYAECGDFDRAIKYQTQAVNIKGPEKGYSLKERSLREEERPQNLRLYLNHKPVRDDFKRNY